jgi:maltooligosyltrehalose trehalohydrolase
MQETMSILPLQLTHDGKWRDLGPRLSDEGVAYRVWALGRKSVVAHIEKKDGSKRTLKLEPHHEPGYFAGTDAEGEAGDLYKYSIDGGSPVPDFMSHYQPRGVMGPSQIVAARDFAWRATNWKRPAWNGQVVYEMHLGTFTPAGTYLSAVRRLDHLRELGITALEIMPVAQAAGTRGWGYDGVMPFAPFHAYGTPDDFRTLVDECHLRGLAVVLDVVFNHLGPEGNFSHHYSDYFFHQGKDSPWGMNFNLDGTNSAPVRAMLRQNIRYWLDEFRIDGFRMDATHAVHDPSPVHVLAEAADIAHGRGAFIIAEDDRNTRAILAPHTEGGWQFDGVWADDFHHVMRVSQTHEQQYFYSMTRGTADELVKTLRDGWLYTGQISPFHQRPRGEPASEFPPQSFVYCISNHDQAGNRLLGDRFHHGISGEAYRALSLFLCLVPYTPMLFMGQEWGATSPFLYFTDMSEETGMLIAEGRRKEFLASNFAKDEDELAKMSHPQEVGTFMRSKLDWEEIQREEHQRLWRLYRDGLRLRRELFGAENPPRDRWTVEKQGESGVVVSYRLEGRTVHVGLGLDAEAVRPPGNKVVLRSNAESYAGADVQPGPETIVTEE